MRTTAALALTFALRPLMFVIYFLSGFVPRRPHLWVFGSWGGHRFADNSAAYFEFCAARRDPAVQLVWISRQRRILRDLRARGFEAHWVWSPAGIVRCLRAGAYLFDCFAKDINYWLSRGAQRINLWSGVPLKVFERDIDTPGSRYYRLFHGPLPIRFLYSMMMPWHVSRPDLLIATSEETRAVTARAFDVDPRSVVVTGFPRNDRLFEDPGSPERRSRCPDAVLAAADAGKKVFLYLPTFRDTGKPFLDIDWQRLHEQMEELGAVFFIKFHPVDATQYRSEHPTIVQLFQDVDVYDVLSYTSALISDYSSIIFDFMLLGRPIVYYVPDLEQFKSGCRSMVFEPEEVAVGPLCRSPGELHQALTDIAGGAPDSEVEAKHRATVMRRLHTHVDGGANRRVHAAVQQLVLPAAAATTAFPPPAATPPAATPPAATPPAATPPAATTDGHQRRNS